MHFLATNSGTKLIKIINDVKNSGLQLWIFLAIKDTSQKNVDVIEEYFEKLNNVKDFEHNKENKISNNLFSLIEEIEKDKKYSSVSFNNKDVNTLLKYVELYFNNPSNFSSSNDYSKFNEPILNNLYNWYLEDLKENKEEIKDYCKQFEQIISNMQQLLIEYFDNTVYKYNLICTICKTNEILNTLKLNILNKNKNENENDSQKKFLETENELMKTILKSIKLTPTIKI